MRVRTPLLWLLWLCACESDLTKIVPATSIMLRVQAAPAVLDGGSALRIRIARQSGDEWREREPYELAFADIHAWPVDLPVTPADAEDGKRLVEFVADALDADGASLAQARAITRFALREQRVLEVVLDACGERALGDVCETRGDCHGSGCQACQGGACDVVRVTSPDALEVFDDSVVVPGFDGGPKDGGLDASDARDQDAGMNRLDSGSDAGAGCDDGATRCDSDLREVCEDGRFVVKSACDSVCMNGQCVGVCKPGHDLPKCSDSEPLVPVVCNAQGQWSPNDMELDGADECPFVCEEGECRGECTPGSDRCENGSKQECSTEGRWGDARDCDQFCGKSACTTAPSCGRNPRCGANASCCRAPFVPAGDFLRGYDGADNLENDLPASVSAFQLDRFEVSVGRFRAWVNSYAGSASYPKAGEGANTANSHDKGWDSNWSGNLPSDGATLRAELTSCVGATWTNDGIDANEERKPIVCVSWFVAQAFCIWDGGRLPTEAEWNYAASGGNEQRVYPWSSSMGDPTIEPAYAVYDGIRADVVGSRGHFGRWGHADLAGNVSEWVQDWFSEEQVPECKDCANLTSTLLRVIRGGDFMSGSISITSNQRAPYDPVERSERIGFRCARNAGGGQ